MSGIVLSAAVRQNLLSLQSTASLLATTQNDLATGNRVNSALDNPTNYFTAQGLNNRASDIGNLLDAIGNGVQVLQAANTGITSLQSLVASAQSIANQVLQSPTGYSTKSGVTSLAISGANANNLLGTPSGNTAATGTAVNSAAITGGASPISAATRLVGTAGSGSNDLAAAISNGAVLTVDGKNITFSTGQTSSTTDASGNVTIGIGTGSALTVGDVLSAIDHITGSTTASSVSAGKIVLQTGSTQDLVVSGTSNVLSALGISAGTTKIPSTVTGNGLTTPAAQPIAGSTTLSHLGTAIDDGAVLTVNGKTITFSSAHTGAATASGGNYTIGFDSTVAQLETVIDTLGGSTSSVSAGQLVLHAGASTDLTIAGDGTSNVLTALGLSAGTTTRGTAATGNVINDDTRVAISTSTTLDKLSSQLANNSTLIIDGKTITFSASQSGVSAPDANGNVTVGIGAGTAATVGQLLGAIDTITGATGSTVSGTGQLKIKTGNQNLVIGGTAVSTLGLAPATTNAATSVTGTAVNNDATSSTVAISATTNLASDLATAITNGAVLTVDGKNITFSTGATTSTTDASGNVTIGIGTGSALTIGDVLSAIDAITGSTTASSVSNGQIVLQTGTTQNLAISGSTNVLSALGLTAGTTSDLSMSGKTLTVGATAGGTATNITFGTGDGQISTLNQLNAALAANNLQASIDTSGKITITTTNDAASATMGAIGGTAVTATVGAFKGVPAAAAPVVDPNAQASRAGLVGQYNNVLAQINTTASDTSFNGVNLLNGDTLKLVFDESGKSTLSITGVTFNIAGLGLSTLTAGTDFLDNSSANKALSALNAASTTLRSEASSLGSNLSMVQIRQDFNKNLINVLQTGASNLTLADTNEEAANSQALSTRQSIAVSALALANQSQQSVLQLLR
ncbi:MAG: flagellin [Bradyrhizobium sp.]|uniref:flagellin N-terminal helical domain-containing protein n=1 Tax=Bradyrhizobium sp. TaxID=376 RepID=UPI001D338B8E|nr:flagellin [Bradyrhizobium sp.]MBV9563910.1 flagellin [Bradyrhizobium sp.]